jgi:hypothetical protein
VLLLGNDSAWNAGTSPELQRDRQSTRTAALNIPRSHIQIRDTPASFGSNAISLFRSTMTGRIT